MKVLFISNQFPDATQPFRGLDNARLVSHLARSCQIRVVAPRPTLRIFPFQTAGGFRCRPEDETLMPEYPRTAYVPKIGSRVNHLLTARSLRGTVLRIRRSFPFDIALVAWVYPDGCAVAQLSRKFGFPFVAVAQGTDVHQYLQLPARRKIIVASMQCASSVISRSSELARLLCDAGLSRTKVQVIYNGVDSSLFRPGERHVARDELCLPPDASVILYVGNFLPVKNPLLLVSAHAQLCRRPNARHYLVMLGQGPLWEQARRLARSNEVERYTLFLGQKSPPQVARYMQAADVLCVPSLNEGVPNVILQSFACGLPVVATRAGGIPEVVAHDFLGRLVVPGDISELVDALADQLVQPRQIEAIRRYATRFSWEQTAAHYLAVLQQALAVPENGSCENSMPVSGSPRASMSVQ